MKKIFFITLINILLTISSYANTSDIVCSNPDQSFLFVGNDHAFKYTIKDREGNATNYTQKEIRYHKTSEINEISKQREQINCDVEDGIATFLVSTFFTQTAKLEKKDGTVFQELNGKKFFAITILCKKIERKLGDCESHPIEL